VYCLYRHAFPGLNANIMSLGGIAIAVGAMVDAAIVMIENAHKRLEEWDHQHPGEQIDNATRWKVITNASVEVGPALFISLLIITYRSFPSLPLRGRKGGCLVRWPSPKRTPWQGRPRWPSS
jgi:Cu(I)/Ag(I) efflux system membrane protein CusA/SilA